MPLDNEISKRTFQAKVSASAVVLARCHRPKLLRACCREVASLRSSLGACVARPWPSLSGARPETRSWSSAAPSPAPACGQPGGPDRAAPMVLPPLPSARCALAWPSWTWPSPRGTRKAARGRRPRVHLPVETARNAFHLPSMAKPSTRPPAFTPEGVKRRSDVRGGTAWADLGLIQPRSFREREDASCDTGIVRLTAAKAPTCKHPGVRGVSDVCRY
jgi:hypothetical protein